MSTVNYQRLESADNGPRSFQPLDGDESIWDWLNIYPSFWSWRTIFEVVLVLSTLVSLALWYQPPFIELGPGAAPFVHIPSVSTKMEASSYWIEVDMFYNKTTLIDKMRRFNELSGDGRGVLMLDNWRDYSLPPPQILNVTHLHQQGPEIKESYTVAYYHHIHCIATVAKLFHNARTGDGTVEEDDEHMVHCLEVLRNAVMCFADTTLEDGVDYWENTHMCRDHSQLQAWSQERAIWNFTDMIGDRVDYLR